jgi:hypothetical protein
MDVTKLITETLLSLLTKYKTRIPNRLLENTSSTYVFFNIGALGSVAFSRSELILTYELYYRHFADTLDRWKPIARPRSTEDNTNTGKTKKDIHASIPRT